MNERAFAHQVSGAIADYLYQELQLHPGQGHYRVVGATSGPRVLTLAMLINPKFTPKVIGLADQLSMAAGLDRQATIRAARGNRGTLSLEIPKPESLWYNIGITALPNGRGLKAPVGIDVEHRPASVDFGNPLTPHLLAAGTTGSGKTNTARLLIYDLARGNRPEDMSLILMDTRKRGAAWRLFRSLPHLAHPIITNDGEALQALGWAVAELDRRSVDGRTSPRLFLTIDEAQAILDREEFIKPVGDLVAVGREFGIHLVIITQKPTAEFMGNAAIKDNLTTRITGKVNSGQAAVIATGLKATGAELLTGPGDQLLVQPSGVKRITTALVTERDMRGLPRSETVPSLDLDQFEDIDRVREQANVKAAPMEAAHVAWSLAYPGKSQQAMRRQFHIGWPRIKKAQQFAAEVLAELGELGYHVCNGATVQRHEEDATRYTAKQDMTAVALQSE